MDLFHFHFIYAEIDGNLAMLADEVDQEYMLWCDGIKDDAQKIEAY